MRRSPASGEWTTKDLPLTQTPEAMALVDVPNRLKVLIQQAESGSWSHPLPLRWDQNQGNCYTAGATIMAGQKMASGSTFTQGNDPASHCFRHARLRTMGQ